MSSYTANANDIIVTSQHRPPHFYRKHGDEWDRINFIDVPMYYTITCSLQEGYALFNMNYRNAALSKLYLYRLANHVHRIIDTELLTIDAALIANDTIFIAGMNISQRRVLKIFDSSYHMIKSIPLPGACHLQKFNKEKIIACTKESMYLKNEFIFIDINKLVVCKKMLLKITPDFYSYSISWADKLSEFEVLDDSHLVFLTKMNLPEQYQIKIVSFDLNEITPSFKDVSTIDLPNDCCHSNNSPPTLNLGIAKMIFGVHHLSSFNAIRIYDLEKYQRWPEVSYIKALHVSEPQESSQLDS